MKWANENHVKYVIFLGEEEMIQDKLTLKNMSNGKQQLLTLDEIMEMVKV